MMMMMTLVRFCSKIKTAVVSIIRIVPDQLYQCSPYRYGTGCLSINTFATDPSCTGILKPGSHL